MTTLDAAYFDQWYADMGTSPARDAIIARAMGLPPQLRDAGTLTMAGIGEVTEALRLKPGALLLDIACGRGGYGIEVALRAGARLAGVDFSAVAVGRARITAAERLPEGRADFRVGSLVETGLPDGAADGLMCIDAVQFAEPPIAGLREFRRLLAPGGRIVLTCWEPADRTDDTVLARLRGVDLRRDLPAAGFVDVQVHDRPDWRAAERGLWEAALAAPDDDAAVRAMQAEGRRSLATFDSLRRVYATATAP
jgi:SAM-dependent methyltransferase